MKAIDILQPSIRWNEYAETPHQFMQMLNRAKVVHHVPVRQLGLAKIVIVRKEKKQ